MESLEGGKEKVVQGYLLGKPKSQVFINMKNKLHWARSHPS